jgi:hypothetical protein
MKRRELLALAITTPVVTTQQNPTALGALVAKLYANTSYGKFCGGRVIYADTDGVVTVTDIKSEYPWTLKLKH